MRRDKKTINFAKGLLKLSLEDGRFSEQRATAILQTLQKSPPRNYPSVLKEYLKLVKREVANSTAVVEHAGALSQAALEAIGASFTAHYGRPISVVASPSDSLIAGLRVRVGCDVYDASVAGALRELESSLA